MSATTDGRNTRWEEHRRERRKALVEGALDAIRTHGPRVGMDEIATAAGTSKTVFYRHFADRAGLHRAVAERVDRIVLRDLARALGAATAGIEDDRGGQVAEGEAPRGVRPAVGDDAGTDVGADPRRLIEAAVGAYLALVERDPEVYRFVVAAPLLHRGELDETGDPAGAVSGHVAEQVAGLVRDALVAAGRDPGPARAWGHGLVGLVRAAADAWLVTGLPSTAPGEPAGARMTREELTTALTTLAWQGLSAAWSGGEDRAAGAG